MTIAEIQENAKTKMNKTKDVLRADLMAIRAGRANPQLLDRITVDYYGSQTPLKSVANISAPEPRVLQINPFEARMVKEISKAIQASDLGLTPSNDGKVIRLMLPELTEERRKELTKLVRKTAEESKVAVRAIRRDAVDQVKKLKKNSEITEDDQKKAEEAIQKLTDANIKDVDKITADKEKEIMEVR
ncbi:MAG: ribosome recycling factor [Clostridiales bacterium]|nr:ribosome recycling factor [Clostridiales bacterium]